MIDQINGGMTNNIINYKFLNVYILLKMVPLRQRKNYPKTRNQNHGSKFTGMQQREDGNQKRNQHAALEVCNVDIFNKAKGKIFYGKNDKI